MKLHEYQARQLFAEYLIPHPGGIIANTPEEAAAAADSLGGSVVIKAQVLVGGRGKAGGVKTVDSPETAKKAAETIIGMNLKGETVEHLLVVPKAEIIQEYYLGLTLDRGANCLTLILSPAGGMDIEALAETKPDRITRIPVYPHKGVNEDELMRTCGEIFNSKILTMQAVDIIRRIYCLYLEKGCTLIEINPLARLADSTLSALDGKITIDDNAAEIIPGLLDFRNPEEYSVDETEAGAAGLTFVSMDGEIGCIVNGAGLAMATMDIIKYYGASPANFLDVGGSSNPEKVVTALTILMRNPKVTAILVNIFGGITRCDDIAKGIIEARKQIDLMVPMVIRLIGTNDKEGREILLSAGLTAEDSLSTAVRKVVELSKSTQPVTSGREKGTA